MWPFASFSFESSSTSPKTALGAAPPYNAGMQIARRAARFDLGVNQAAQADAQRRNAFGVQLGVGDQRDIGLQLGRIFGDVFGHRFAADFLFAFDQELQVDRQRAVDRAQRLHGFDVRSTSGPCRRPSRARRDCRRARSARRAARSIPPADRAAARRNGRSTAPSACRARAASPHRPADGRRWG